MYLNSSNLKIFPSRCNYINLTGSVWIRIWIRIHMFLGLSDPHPDPLGTSTDPDPLPVSHKSAEGTEIMVEK